jgi:hypothetical protein
MLCLLAFFNEYNNNKKKKTTEQMLDLNKKIKPNTERNKERTETRQVIKEKILLYLDIYLSLRFFCLFISK